MRLITESLRNVKAICEKCSCEAGIGVIEYDLARYTYRVQVVHHGENEVISVSRAQLETEGFVMAFKGGV